LAEHGLSELQFAVLVALFALDPEPVMPADLADYAAVSRAAVTEALARLEAHGLIHRTRDTTDRRAHHLHLTDRGRNTTEAALAHYLGAVGGIARYLEPATQGDLLSAYQKLQRGAAAITR
ncbi:MAG TPA: MarR family transcriptional regulator, partial [Opitutaceae bacterium]